MSRIAQVLIFVAAEMGFCPPILGDQIELSPSKDTTIYEDPAGQLSNGSGEFLFAGRVASIGDNRIRRAFLSFAVDAAIPAGALITDVSLTLRMSRSPTDDQPVGLHRVLTDWGEGASDAPLREGKGTTAEPNDATWRHSHYNTQTWSSLGGDFVSAPSAVQSVGGIGSYTWSSTPGLVENVQGWLDDPATNFGWAIVGNESVAVTVKRFNSREFVDDPLQRPKLTVEYVLPDCFANADCADTTVCTFDRCVDFECQSEPSQYGDIAGGGSPCGPDGIIDIQDIFAVIDGFQDMFAEGCEPINIDIAGAEGPCLPDALIDILDIFAVLDAFQSIDPCCP